MEDVLEVYQRPHDPAHPVVCLDETLKQLIAETRVLIPGKPRHPARIDYEYERNGTANLFIPFAPLEGWWHVKVTDRHTAAADYAQVLREVSDSHFPGADKIVLVQDNLSTHKPASMYEAFPPAEAAGPWSGSSGLIPCVDGPLGSRRLPRDGFEVVCAHVSGLLTRSPDRWSRWGLQASAKQRRGLMRPQALTASLACRCDR
ncbi:MAG: hypothetical protein B7Z80_25225 [Rhodospirillales bacterium 20-64-7]|nr:MAG: hypothetical protein B7Z80_25225 [Rhodospirillales bacterium 20-64-7]HQT79208.1 transposase [Rhodopila sp.]